MCCEPLPVAGTRLKILWLVIKKFSAILKKTLKELGR